MYALIFRNLTVQVLLGALVGFGLAQLTSGWDVPALDSFMQLTKVTFLAALRMLIAPLIFFSLIGGIAAIGDVVRLRTLGAATVSYYLVTTGIAAVLGWIAAVHLHPWTAYPAAIPDGLTQVAAVDPGGDSIVLMLTELLRQALVNPFSALVEMNVLGIVLNAFLIGIAIAIALPPDNLVIRGVTEINRILTRILRWIMVLLPLGVMAIIYDFTARLSIGDQPTYLLEQLFRFVAIVAFFTAIHGLIVLPLLARFVGGMPLRDFFRGVSQPGLVALSTSSSLATLPVTIQSAESSMGVDKSVASFVLPLGATMNMDGTALFEAVAAFFLAYLYGVEISSTAAVIIFMMAMVSSIGAPGMPSASMAGMQMVLLAVGIPIEGIAILLIVERPLDTIRTAVNVIGDLAGSVIVQRYVTGRGGFS